MIDHYEATVRDLYAFIIANAPPGAEREVARAQVELDERQTRDYLSLEFRPSNDTGCHLYVRIEPPDGRWTDSRHVDSEGNEWSSYRVRCDVSWASWGSADLDTCQRRLDVINATMAFARAIEAAFPNVFHRMDATAQEVAERKERHAKKRAKHTVIDLVRKHAKGLKVGQERFVVAPPEGIMPIGSVEVEREECGRRFKYCATVTATQGFYFTRVA